MVITIEAVWFGIIGFGILKFREKIISKQTQCHLKYLKTCFDATQLQKCPETTILLLLEQVIFETRANSIIYDQHCVYLEYEKPSKKILYV